MKLYHSPFSPFSRKTVIVAEVLGLSDRITIVPGRGNVMLRDPEFRAMNPSGQIPVLFTDEGEALFDSPVICDYLDNLAGRRGVIGSGAERWRNLRDQALSDTMLDAALQCRYEIGLRPEANRWADWLEAWRSKIEDTLAAFESRAGELHGRLDVGCDRALLRARLHPRATGRPDSGANDLPPPRDMARRVRAIAASGGLGPVAAGIAIPTRSARCPRICSINPGAALSD